MVGFFFLNDTATTEIYTRSIVGSVRCVQETACSFRNIANRYRQTVLSRYHIFFYRITIIIHYYCTCTCIFIFLKLQLKTPHTVSYTHLRAHETSLHLVCRLLLEKKKKTHKHQKNQYITYTQFSRSNFQLNMQHAHDMQTKNLK
eukprot:TRINITY_DN20319_c0_g1_i1.p1 TRINITY_DN20319_c0_g1~~TRINITY_DN20319_c0_g1_i1.p1  ORF type:complete len:145 (+),score=8.17 TRINITY_DN20319_c0_g1_i1:87-521(+)